MDTAVTSAMRKNARWSGIGVSGLRMGSLGNSMGLRSAQLHSKDSPKEASLAFFILDSIFIHTLTIG